MTQRDRILRHFKDHKSITPLQAMHEYGIMRLAARICEMKSDGVSIKSELVKGRNRYGEPISYSKYTINEQV